MADTTTKILSVQLDATQAVNGILRLNDAIDANNKQMALNKQAIKDNEAEMKKAGADTQELAKKNLDLRKANEQLAAETKVLAGEKRTLQKEVQNEIKAQSQEIGSMKQLEAQLSNLKKEYKSLSEAEREFGKRGIELRNEINKTTTELKKAEYGIQEYYRNVGNYQNAILNALGINGRFGQSIMGLTNMQGGFGGAMTAMGNSVKAFGASLMGLLTNPVFLALAGIVGVGMAFKWFYDYNEGLAEASRLTSEFTGLHGEEMQAFRNKVMATADVMDKDFKETLQAADAVMANFHVDGQQAMDIINKGFAAGADVNGDFLGKVKQLAPTFHDAGIAADEMVAIITQTKSGIFTDQGLEAIRQGSARIREMSNTTKQALQGIGIDVDQMQAKLRDGSMSTFEAIQQVSAQLKTLPDNAQEVGEVMSAVFGRQGKFASQEMIESLAEMSTSLDDVMAKTGEYGELLLENIDTEEELDNVTSALFDMTDNGWENIKQQATIYAKKALVAVVKALIDVANWFIKLYNSSLPVRAVFNGFVAQMKILWSAAKTAFNLIIDGFKAMGRGINAIVNMFSQAGNAISAFGEGIYLMFNGIMNRSLADIKKGWGILKNGVKGAVKSTMDGFVNALTGTWSEASADVNAFFTDLGNIAMDAISNTMNGRIDEIRIPAIVSGGGGGSASTGGGGGGGGSASSSGGSGGRNRNRNGGSRKTGGGSRSSGGGVSKKSGGSSKKSSGKTPEQKAEEDAQKKLKELIEEAEKARMRALQERAKKEKEAVDELYEMQKAALIKKYGTLEDLEKRLDNATTDAQRNQAQAAIDGYNSLMQNLEDNRQNMYDAIDKAEEDAIKKREERQAAIAKQLAQIYLETSKEGSEAQLIWQKDLLDKEEEQELAAAVDSEELKNAIIAKYAKKREQLEKEHADKRKQAELERMNKELTAYQTYAETMLASTEEWQEQNLQYQLQVLQAQMVAELAMYENNEIMKAAIREKYAKMELDARRTHTQAVITAEQEKYNAITSMVSGLGDVIGEFGEQSKEAAILQKTLALGEVLVAQAVAIANAVKAGSNAANPWQMIAQIAASVTAVTVAMVQAFKALNQAKFATGGYIQGAGTGTSDSIPVRVSNGESIMNANTTAMFGGLLSSLNQLGGGVPIQVQQTAQSVRGEDMLARAVARGVAMLPNPVVSVEDINKGQRQVQVMNERATL